MNKGKCLLVITVKLWELAVEGGLFMNLTSEVTCNIYYLQGINIWSLTDPVPAIVEAATETQYNFWMDNSSSIIDVLVVFKDSWLYEESHELAVSEYMIV